MVTRQRSPVQSLILRILADRGSVYTTALVKLTYLIDYFYFRQQGRSATGLEWIWDEYGPNALGHKIIKEAGALEDEGEIVIRPAPGSDRARAFRSVSRVRPTFDPILEAIIDDVLKGYGSMTVDELKEASKRTLPFKYARPGRMLVLTRSERAESTVTDEDWARHRREREQGAGKSIAELRAKYLT